MENEETKRMTSFYDEHITRLDIDMTEMKSVSAKQSAQLEALGLQLNRIENHLQAKGGINFQAAGILLVMVGMAANLVFGQINHVKMIATLQDKSISQTAEDNADRLNYIQEHRDDEKQWQGMIENELKWVKKIALETEGSFHDHLGSNHPGPIKEYANLKFETLEREMREKTKGRVYRSEVDELIKRLERLEHRE